MRDVNTLALSGRLGRDPEHRKTQRSSLCNFSMAVNENVKVDDEWREQTNWFDVTVWGKQADLCAEYLSKGSRVFVQGRLKEEKWEAEDGSKRRRVVVVADVVLWERGDDTQPRRQSSASEEDFGSIDFDDDIDF